MSSAMGNANTAATPENILRRGFGNTEPPPSEPEGVRSVLALGAAGVCRRTTLHTRSALASNARAHILITLTLGLIAVLLVYSTRRTGWTGAAARSHYDSRMMIVAKIELLGTHSLPLPKSATA